jgi:hypothetical protein
MSVFGNNLAKYLAKNLDVSEDLVIEALDNYNPSIEKKKQNIKKEKEDKKVEKEDKKTEKKVEKENKKVEKKEVEKDKKDDKKVAKKSESHTCERIKRGGIVCGKPANKQYPAGNGKWYCGTEKSLCYSIELKNAVKNNPPLDESEAKTTNSSSDFIGKSTKNNTKVVKSESDVKSLINKVIQRKQIDVIEKVTKNGKKVFVDRNSRALYDQENKVFYGMLDEDDSIVPLTEKLVKELEGSGFYVKKEQTKANVYQKRDTISRSEKSEDVSKEAYVESDNSSEFSED